MKNRNEKSFPLDKIDLRIIRLLNRNSRASFREMSSMIGLTSNAIKTRINRMVSEKIIQRYYVGVNPVIFGYESECFLTITYQKSSMIHLDEIIKKISLFGDILVYTKILGSSLIFYLVTREEIEDKAKLLSELLQPVLMDSKFAKLKPASLNLSHLDFRIIECLLSSPRMEIKEIAKHVLASPRRVRRRMDKMYQNKILLNYGIITDISSMRLVGYIEFILVIDTEKSHHLSILDRIYHELDEYLVDVYNPNQDQFIFANFFCSNIPNIDMILTTIESYNGVRTIELAILSKIEYYEDWLRKSVNKKLNNKVRAFS